MRRLPYLPLETLRYLFHLLINSSGWRFSSRIAVWILLPAKRLFEVLSSIGFVLQKWSKDNIGKFDPLYCTFKPHFSPLLILILMELYLPYIMFSFIICFQCAQSVSFYWIVLECLITPSDTDHYIYGAVQDILGFVWELQFKFPVVLNFKRKQCCLVQG